MGPISGRKMILLDAPLEVLLGRLRLWFRTWTVGSPAKGAFTLQDDSGGGRNKRGEQVPKRQPMRTGPGPGHCASSDGKCPSGPRSDCGISYDGQISPISVVARVLV